MKKFLWGLTCFLLLWLSGPVGAKKLTLRLATTTSTDNTGLLDYLAPKFKRDTGIELQWIAVGTGKALRLGQNCDVDVLLVHAPAAEKAFVARGYGIERQKVMYNDFVLVGPPEDPAKLKGLSIIEAFRKIASVRARFVSRGDDSGTHKKELQLWYRVGLTPQTLDRQPWYIQTGQGMMATLLIAAEKKAYTLTDRGTYLRWLANYQGKAPLKILVEGDQILRNQYSVILVNPARCPNVKTELARVFSSWLTSPKIQREIEAFRLFGKPLFIPNAQEGPR